MPFFGSHLSVAGSFINAVNDAELLGCQSVQIFTKAPNQWRGRDITAKEAGEFRKAVKKAKLRFPTAHDSYLINLASPDDALYQRSIEAFVEEIHRAELLGLKYLVTHPGAHMGTGEKVGLARVVAALDVVHERTQGAKVCVLIETTAGQGTSLGHRFEHLKVILAGVRHSRRLGVCLDTCHIFAAGYDIRTRQAYNSMRRSLARTIGLRRIKALHLNDSLKPLGSRVDRHAHIGAGEIGRAAFGFVVNDPAFRRLPMILETPKENDMDKVNLALLWRLLRLRRTSRAT